jgi:predicted glutamine amidotransferase
MSTIQDLLNERARRKEAMTNGIIKSFQPEIEKSNETDFYDEVEKNKEFLKKKKEAKSKNKAYDKKVKKVMDEFKNGELTTSNGELVTERKQALAIALSEAKDLKKSEYDDLDLKKAIEHEDFWDELSKAHQDGDVHPNGKWVWVSSANGGRGDWRTQGGRTHNKTNDNKV